MTDDCRATSPDLPIACQTCGDQDLAALARANGLSDAAADAVAMIDAVMTKVRRSMVRREFGRQLIAALDPDLEVTHLDVIGAIGYGAAIWGDTGQGEVTVGLIAERLGIDPSRASRVSAELVERGYARRVASQQDARRICLELTPKGQRTVDAVRQNKWNRFAGAMSQWNEADLVTFAVLLERFSSWATDNDGIRRAAEAVRKTLEEAQVEAAAAPLDPG